MTKVLKEEYDSRKIKKIFMQGVENDLQKIKQDDNKLEELRKQIRDKDKQILEIKLQLKWWR